LDINWPESKIAELLEGAIADVEYVSIYSFANEAADHAPHRALGSIIDKLAELPTFTVLNGKGDESSSDAVLSLRMETNHMVHPVA